METLDKDVKKIREYLSNDIYLAADKLLQFANTYTKNSQLKRRALHINWELELNENSNPKEYEIIRKEISDLLAQVVESADENPEQTQIVINKRQKLRKKYLSKEESPVAFRGINLSYQYPGADSFTLQPLNLTLRLGEICAVVGENGSGKSTLIKAVAGEHSITNGCIEYPLFAKNSDKSNVNSKIDWSVIKERIGYIPQRINQWAGKVEDYLHLTAAVKGIRGQKNREEVEYIMHRLGLLKFAKRNWGQLSGGQQMRVELARVLVWKPQLLILDEPLANLDINAQAIFLRDLKDLANSFRHPISVLITSQHLFEIESISNRIVFIKEGSAIYNDVSTNFGKDRKNNTFEFDSNADINTIRMHLLKQGIKDVWTHGQSYVISTPLEFDSKKMLSIFANLERDIEISYFRDISQSTRVLFE